MGIPMPGVIVVVGVILLHAYFGVAAIAVGQTAPGLLLVNVTVKDQKQFEEYATRTRPILASHQATPLFRGTNATVLAGDQPHKTLIGIRFPSKAAINAFYNSPEYQALIPLRTAAADVVFTAYDIAQEPQPGAHDGQKALLAVDVLVKDPARFGEYGQAAVPVVQTHGGTFRLRAVNPEVLFGAQRHKVLVLFGFPSQESIKAFYNSPAYQQIIPIRVAGADTVFVAYDL